MDAIKALPRGVGSGGGYASLVTGEEVSFGPDLSLFVSSRADAYRLVDWVSPFDPPVVEAEDRLSRWKRPDRAYVDYRPTEPQWLQVKLCVEPEHEEVLQRLSRALSYRDDYLDHDLIKWAIDPANHRQPYGMRINDLIEEVTLAAPGTYNREPFFKPTADERSAIRDLCKQKELSCEAVMRQALRLYQLHDTRIMAGETITWSGDAQRVADFAGGATHG